MRRVLCASLCVLTVQQLALCTTGFVGYHGQLAFWNEGKLSYPRLPVRLLLKDGLHIQPFLLGDRRRPELVVMLLNSERTSCLDYCAWNYLMDFWEAP